MKKLISILLALALVMSLAPAAFASNGVGNNGSDSADVKATYHTTASATVYSVEISWSTMEFTYNAAFKGTWNAEKHQYEGATPAGWAEGSGTITVTNHSNTAITATPTYVAVDGFDTATMNFSSNALQLGSADNGVDGAAGQPEVGTINVTPGGTLPENANGTKIGTITITIS